MKRSVSGLTTYRSKTSSSLGFFVVFPSDLLLALSVSFHGRSSSVGLSDDFEYAFLFVRLLAMSGGGHSLDSTESAAVL